MFPPFWRSVYLFIYLVLSIFLSLLCSFTQSPFSSSSHLARLPLLRYMTFKPYIQRIKLLCTNHSPSSLALRPVVSGSSPAPEENPISFPSRASLTYLNDLPFPSLLASRHSLLSLSIFLPLAPSPPPSSSVTVLLLISFHTFLVSSYSRQLFSFSLFLSFLLFQFSCFLISLWSHFVSLLLHDSLLPCLSYFLCPFFPPALSSYTLTLYLSR